MRRGLLFFVVYLLSGALKGYAFCPENPAVQDTVRNNPKKDLPQTLWVNVGQIGRREILVNYERAFDEWNAVEIGLGYKYAVKSGQPYRVNIPSLYNGEFYNFAEGMPFSQGIMASLAFKSYAGAKPHKGLYFSPQVFYRYRFYNRQFVSSGVMASDDPQNWASLQDLDLHIFGGKFIFGSTLDQIQFKNNTALKLDLYGGFGFRVKKATTTFYSKSSTSSGSNYTPPGYTPTPATTVPQPEPWTEEMDNVMFSVHAGIKLGFQF